MTTRILTPKKVDATYSDGTLEIEASGEEDGVKDIRIIREGLEPIEPPVFEVVGDDSPAIGLFPYDVKGEFKMADPHEIMIHTMQGDQSVHVGAGTTTDGGTSPVLGGTRYNITVNGPRDEYTVGLPVNAGTGASWQVVERMGSLPIKSAGECSCGNQPGALTFAAFTCTRQEHFGNSADLVLKGPNGEELATATVTINRD